MGSRDGGTRRNTTLVLVGVLLGCFLTRGATSSPSASPTTAASLLQNDALSSDGGFSVDSICEGTLDDNCSGNLHQCSGGYNCTYNDKTGTCVQAEKCTLGEDEVRITNTTSSPTTPSTGATDQTVSSTDFDWVKTEIGT
eukprot:CAMPEP_0198208746 /NCGR_PEP_ID=MMETSP1445-20131203/12095_1 /TAXON_ID=36898 /ORGANISM="Pyramimonas sp., Strain CCMP2087" /LENGTH=139 /DNA_ID=CAMNT_0043882271 /DNA_START=233 /DNA_END=649 /DNA_ORIENTATION=+